MSVHCLRYIVFTCCVSICAGVLPLLVHAESRTWKYVHELSDQERSALDPRTDTPRDAALPYLPAEPYPFTAPYTAEEIGFRTTEFPHMARWNHVQIEDYGAITHTGYLFKGSSLVLSPRLHAPRVDSHSHEDASHHPTPRGILSPPASVSREIP